MRTRIHPAEEAQNLKQSRLASYWLAWTIRVVAAFRNQPRHKSCQGAAAQDAMAPMSGGIKARKR
jgi:hypothetical protein